MTSEGDTHIMFAVAMLSKALRRPPGPEDDFYQYVNKKWLDDPENKIPAEYSSWFAPLPHFTQTYSS